MADRVLVWTLTHFFKGGLVVSVCVVRPGLCAYLFLFCFFRTWVRKWGCSFSYVFYRVFVLVFMRVNTNVLAFEPQRRKHPPQKKNWHTTQTHRTKTRNKQIKSASDAGGQVRRRHAVSQGIVRNRAKNALKRTLKRTSWTAIPRAKTKKLKPRHITQTQNTKHATTKKASETRSQVHLYLYGDRWQRVNLQRPISPWSGQVWPILVYWPEGTRERAFWD